MYLYVFNVVIYRYIICINIILYINKLKKCILKKCVCVYIYLFIYRYRYRSRYRYRYGLDLFFNYGGRRSLQHWLVGGPGALQAALKFLHVREVHANLSVLVAAQHQLIGTPIVYRCALCFSWWSSLCSPLDSSRGLVQQRFEWECGPRQQLAGWILEGLHSWRGLCWPLQVETRGRSWQEPTTRTS